MAQSARFRKNPLSINPFRERASAEPPLEWNKRAAIVELAVFAKDGIEIQSLLREKPESTLPTEPILEVERQGKTEAQRKNREVRNRQKNVDWENKCQKAREKGVMCSSVVWDEADARVRSCLFICLSTEGQIQVQQKRSRLNIQTTTIRVLEQVLQDIFITQRVIAFERYIFICRKKKKKRNTRTIPRGSGGTSLSCRLWSQRRRIGS